jgi:hypothetical protein
MANIIIQTILKKIMVDLFMKKLLALGFVVSVLFSSVFAQFNNNPLDIPEKEYHFHFTDDDIIKQFHNFPDDKAMLDEKIKNLATSPVSSAPEKTVDFDQIKLFAENGQPEFQFMLGRCYANGEGTEKNMDEALKWYTLSAENGFYKAQNNLAVMYMEGDGVEKDYEKAKLWLNKALVKNKTYPNLGLGIICIEESGDYKTAMKHFKEAEKAGGNEIVSTYALIGKVYADEGSGMLNYKKAVDYFTKAANRGNISCQYTLGVFYRDGLGVKKNLSEAKKWFKYASLNGYEQASEALAELEK